jgi:hypothetical protein
MVKPPEYAGYLRLAVEQQEMAEDAECRGEDIALIASHLQQAVHFRARAEEAISAIARGGAVAASAPAGYVGICYI